MMMRSKTSFGTHRFFVFVMCILSVLTLGISSRCLARTTGSLKEIGFAKVGPTASVRLLAQPKPAGPVEVVYQQSDAAMRRFGSPDTTGLENESEWDAVVASMNAALKVRTVTEAMMEKSAANMASEESPGHVTLTHSGSSVIATAGSDILRNSNTMVGGDIASATAQTSQSTQTWQFVMAGDPESATRAAYPRLAAQLRQLGTASDPESAVWAQQIDADLRLLLSQTATSAEPELLDRISRALSYPPASGATQELAMFRFLFIEWTRFMAFDDAQLERALNEAAPTFVPCSDLQLRYARIRLTRTLVQTEVLLSQNPSTAAERRRALRTVEIATALGMDGGDLTAADGAMITRDSLEKMTDCMADLEEISPTLRSATYHHLYEHLVRYIALARNRLEPDAVREEYTEALKQLRRILNEDPNLYQAGSAANLGMWLWWISASDQAPWLVGTLRTRYSHRNFYVDVSSDLVGCLLHRPVTWSGKLNETIRGTQIHGTAVTAGDLTAFTADSGSTSALRLQLRFDGMITANTVGVNGPATIRSSSATYILADKPLWFSEQGASTGPAVVRAGTQTQIQDVAAGGPIIQHIAQDQVALEKEKAEYEASQRSAQRFADEMQKQVLETTNKLNANYRKYRRIWSDWKLFPDALAMMSDRVGIQIQGRILAGPEQLSPSPQPPAMQDFADVTVRIHQSAINNVATKLFSGAEVRQESIEAILNELTEGHMKFPQPDGERNTDWAILFPVGLPPVEVEVEQTSETVDGISTGRVNQWIRIYIHGESYLRGRQEARGERSVRVSYRIAVLNGRIAMIRDEASFSSPGLIRAEMKALFPETIVPDDISIDPPEGGGPVTLRLVRLGVQNGWIVASWKRIPSTPGETPIPATPPIPSAIPVPIPSLATMAH